MDLSPTVQVAEEWHRATGRAAPSRDDQMLHTSVQDVQESSDAVDKAARPPPLVFGSGPHLPFTFSPPSPLSPLPASPASTPIPSLSNFRHQIEPFHPDLLSRPLIPFGKFDGLVRDQIRTLLDLVWAALPQSPQIYAAGQLTGTRAMTASEYRIPPSRYLEKIVFCPDMLAPVEPKVAALLHAIPIDWNNDAHMLFAARVFPWLTSLDCPPRIYTEADTEDWIRETIISPAHAVMHAVLLGRIPDDVNPMYPFHSSAHCRFSNRPDNVTTLRGRYPLELVSHIGEWKTKGVISKDKNPLRLIAGPIPDVTDPGAAIRFNWPTEPSSDFDERDKILSQIWCQLLEWDVFLGTLSSMEVTTFFMRTRYDEDTLYMSEFYTADDPILFRMVCWLLVATESNGLSLDVPAPSTDWWTPEIRNDTDAGMVETMLGDLDAEP
ncbi:hypothetical protein EWM64_g4107 [Hericium alpestre]|uniref:Uncharacterized protein n=1 Tax=Hericium alpestre TaxID=135208 RepID=A0A4Z0A2H9_9AGAM|nr:hypothetical protein EWM64_g4107 [Hericium alpestre]